MNAIAGITVGAVTGDRDYRVMVIDRPPDVRIEMHHYGHTGAWTILTLEEARFLAATLNEAADRVEKTDDR